MYGSRSRSWSPKICIFKGLLQGLHIYSDEGVLTWTSSLKSVSHCSICSLRISLMDSYSFSSGGGGSLSLSQRSPRRTERVIRVMRRSPRRTHFHLPSNHPNLSASGGPGPGFLLELLLLLPAAPDLLFDLRSRTCCPPVV